jgi:glycosyltransferase involved in cell wall biosynthesis
MKTPSVEVLLATYNSEKYLNAQIDSLLGQSCQYFRILVRDDGSQDGTHEIIQSYISQHPDKIILIPSQETSTGPTKNFSKLIEASTADYILLCDHDDVWLPNKIEVSLEKIQQMERLHTPDTPILAHSDLTVVNENLEVINDSFFKFQALNSNRKLFGNLLSQNVITGCATIINRALADLSTPIPDQALMHDWWIALIASAFGYIGLIETQTILYRQHFNNILGAQEFSISLRYFYNRARKAFSYRGASIFSKNIEQAQAIRDRFSDRLPDDQLITLDSFLSLSEDSYFKRRYNIIKHGFYKGKFAENIGLFLKI